MTRHSLRRALATRAGGSERGAILLLALGFIVAASLIVLALASWATNDLNNTKTFVTVSQTQQDARSTANVAIGSIRYHPLLGTGQTLNQFSYCWGTSGPSTQSFNFTTEGVGANSVSHATITMVAYCSTAFTPQSAVSRTVTVDVCPYTSATTMSACTTNPYLQAIVQFDDYPNNSTTAVITGVCSTWCGQGQTITSWIWGSSGTSQPTQPTVISVTSTPPNPAYVQGSAYVPVASASGGTPVVISSTTPSVCAVSSGYVEFLAAGNCTLTFDDSGGASYLPAPEVTQSFTVSLNNPVRLTLSPSTPVSYSPGVGYQTTLSTSGGSGSGAVSYSVLSSSTASGCSVSGSTLSAASAGTCDVLATKASDGVYAATSVTGSIAFIEAAQSTLVISSPTTVSNDGTTIATALATSGGSGTGAVTYQVTNGSATGCTVTSGNVLNASSEGTCVVTATKASDGNYLAVSSAATVVTFQQGVAIALQFTSPYTPSTTPDHLVTTVTGFGSNGAPAGSVTVYSNSTSLCTTSTRSTSGLASTFSCDLPSSFYTSGTLTNVYALYTPSNGSPYAQATSASSSLTISRSGTVVTLTPMMVHGTFNQPLVGLLYGYEQDAAFNVSVTSIGGTPATAGDTVTVTVSQKNSATCKAILNAQGQGSCSIGATSVQANSNGASMSISAAFGGDASLVAANSSTITLPLYTTNPDSLGGPSFAVTSRPRRTDDAIGTLSGATSSNSLDNGQIVSVNYVLCYQGQCDYNNNYGFNGSAIATDNHGAWSISQVYLYYYYLQSVTYIAQATEPDYYGPTLSSPTNNL